MHVHSHTKCELDSVISSCINAHATNKDIRIFGTIDMDIPLALCLNVVRLKD